MIKVNALEKRFNKGKSNEVMALRGVSLEMGDTGLYVIYGRSGSGKSTLMDMIGGLNSFDAGTIEIDGTTYTDMVSDEYRIENIGYIFQNYCLDPNENVYENVAMGMRTIGITDEELIFNRTMTALASVDMDEYYKRDVLALSGGQQQRVAIARAIAKGSKVILADEPTGNLDEENTHIVLDILRELSRTTLVILVTHEEDIASTYADKVIEIRDGKVKDITDGTHVESEEESNSTDNASGIKALGHVTAGTDRAVFRFDDTFKTSFAYNFGRRAKAGNKILNIAIVLLTLSIVLVASFLGSAMYNMSVQPHDMLEVNMYFRGTQDEYGNIVGGIDDNGLISYLETSDKISDYYYTGYRSYVNIHMANYDTPLLGNSLEGQFILKNKSSLAKERVVKGAITDSSDGIVVTTKSIAMRFTDVKIDDSVYNRILGAVVVNDKTQKLGTVEAIIDSDEDVVYASDAMREAMALLYEAELLLADLYTDKAKDDTIYVYDGLNPFGNRVFDDKIILNDDGSKYLNVVWIDKEKYPNASKYGYITYNTLNKYRLEIMSTMMNLPNIGVTIFTEKTEEVKQELFNIGSMSIQDSNDMGSMRNHHYYSAIVRTSIELVVVYVLLMVLTAILMYASFASSVKEVGIYRAIGVSKKNIIFKVFVEHLSSTILVALLSLLLISSIIFALGTGAMMTNIYLPWWLFLILMVAVVGGMSLVSIIPVLTIIGKSPREILSRYDI